MTKDNVEFDILINGKPAKKSLNEVKKELKTVEKQNESTTKNINTNWVSVGAAVSVAAVAVGSMINSAARLDKAMFGLNETTKNYIKNISVTSGFSQEIIAGFVQTGKAAGLSSKEIEKMIDMSIALGRAYPHESAETFVDNLAMLNSMGEAQGFIVDILEQKYGTLDLKTISLADKMKVLEEASSGVNVEFEKTSGSKLDQTISRISNATLDLGNNLLRLVDKSGLFWLFEKAVDSVSLSTVGWALLLDLARIKLKEMIGSDVTKDVIEYNKNLEKMDALLLKISGDTPKNTTPPVIDVSKSANESINKAKSDLDAFQGLVDEMMAGLRADLESEAITPEQLLFSEDAIIAWADKVKSGIARGLSMEQAMESTRGALENSINSLSQPLSEFDKQLQSIAMQGVGGISDSFVDMALTGKASFSDMANSMIRDLMRVIAKQMLLNSIKGTVFGGFLGFHTGGEVKHTGGVIGGGSTIPSYHSGVGMRTDERIAKLQVGESVVNRAGTANNAGVIAEMNSGKKIGSSGGNVNKSEILITINAIDTQTGTAFLMANKDTISNIFNQNLNTNGTIRANL